MTGWGIVEGCGSLACLLAFIPTHSQRPVIPCLRHAGLDPVQGIQMFVVASHRVFCPPQFEHLAEQVRNDEVG